MNIVGVYNSDIGDNSRKGWDALINGRRVKQLEFPLISSDESGCEIPKRVIDAVVRVSANLVVRTFKKNGRTGKWYVKYIENKTRADYDAIEKCIIANQTKRPFSGRKCWIINYVYDK